MVSKLAISIVPNFEVSFASCYLPDGARDGDFLFLAAKLTHGRKGEIDLKYIWHNIIPYETLEE